MEIETVPWPKERLDAAFGECEALKLVMSEDSIVSRYIDNLHTIIKYMDQEIIKLLEDKIYGKVVSKMPNGHQYTNLKHSNEHIKELEELIKQILIQQDQYLALLEHKGVPHWMVQEEIQKIMESKNGDFL